MIIFIDIYVDILLSRNLLKLPTLIYLLLLMKTTKSTIYIQLKYTHLTHIPSDNLEQKRPE